MGASTRLPHLLHFRVSHYNEKVRWALDFKGIRHTRRALVPGFHVPVAQWHSGQTKLPILELHGRALTDSSRILAALERVKPDPPLFPTEPRARARAVDIQAYFDEIVAPELRRLFWACYLQESAACARMATDGYGASVRTAWRVLFPIVRPLFRRNMGIYPRMLEHARRRMPAHFDRIEAEVGASGYLVGDRFSVADLGAAAVMTAIVRPPEFPYPLPEPWPSELAVLRDSVADRAGFRWVREIYARHRSVSCEQHPIVSQRGNLCQ